MVVGRCELTSRRPRLSTALLHAIPGHALVLMGACTEQMARSRFLSISAYPPPLLPHGGLLPIRCGLYGRRGWQASGDACVQTDLEYDSEEE
eukprot:1689986-Prymnesium_polylepis.1